MPSFIDKFPQQVRPYMHLMRLDKPVGWIFLYIPNMWTLFMAAYSHKVVLGQTLWFLGLFMAGACLVRGAMTTLNDMADREYDRAVERTKNRPLARGDVSMIQAGIFLVAQLLFGFAIMLGSGFNETSLLLGFAGIAINSLYPFMKRITHWPQLYLGLGINWGVPMGWAAGTNTVDWSVCVPLFIGGMAWTLVYDTIYAYQDKKDDAKIGVGSTAQIFGDNPRFILGFLVATFITLATYAGYENGNSMWYFFGMALSALHHARIVSNTDFNNPKDFWKGFSGCAWAGMWITLGSFLDFVL